MTAKILRYAANVGIGVLLLVAVPLLVVGMVLWFPISILHWFGAMLTDGNQ